MRLPVGADAEQSRVAQLLVDGPFDERDVDDDLRPHPVRTHARQPGGFRERRLLQPDGVESRAQIRQECRVESRPDLAGEDEVVALVVADEQCAESDATGADGDQPSGVQASPSVRPERPRI